MLNIEASAHTEALRLLLGDASPGALVTYREMSDAIGLDIQSHYWPAFQAKRRLAKLEGKVFMTERNVGLRRITTDQLPEFGRVHRHAIGRRARRTAAAIGSALSMANDVSPVTMRKATAEISALRLIAYVTADKVTKRAEKDDADGKPEPVADTAKRMMSTLMGVDI